MNTITQTSLNATFQSVAALRPARRNSTVVRAASDPMLQKPSAPTPASQSAAPMPQAPTGPSSGVSIEYQRQQAKAMQQYFKDQAFEEVVADAKVFGWTKKNEINNGRWVMFGLLVGIMTEAATGVNFIHQIGLMISYMGIADIYD
ncbi:hypothetical protein Ndes2526B_g03203 [Nannochloris sp. 'desiccata']|nr:hypothetical protein KSW81_006570 [Chlorella desiccata (nom. nud.)]